MASISKNKENLKWKEILLFFDIFAAIYNLSALLLQKKSFTFAPYSFLTTHSLVMQASEICACKLTQIPIRQNCVK